MSKLKKNAYSSEEASSSSGSSSSLSSEEEVDAQDLKPIKDYLLDRRDLACQLFKSVKAEKIQMMLPHALKKMDLGQLEELCANELSGMSKARILSILNGKPMAESSDTTESDDSGPSLEIISDTEEWFSDEDLSKKEDGKGKVKKDGVKQKGKLQFQKKVTNKSNQKKVTENVMQKVQVKKEEEVEASKEKDGDSLLDLLELEMRARAIRALIRKEENIIPNASKSTEGNSTLADTAGAKAEQDELKAKENCRRQLEMIISAQQGGTAEDEDVVLVVQPTPTIDLLSSDSEGESHGGVRINKKLQNERVIDNKDKHVNNGDSSTVPSDNKVENLNENKAIENSTETKKTDTSKRVHNDNFTTSSNTNNNNTNNNNNNNNNSNSNDIQSKSNGKKKKIKKKSHSKEQSKNTNSKANAHKPKSSTENQPTTIIKTEDTNVNGNNHENDNNKKTEQDDSSSKKQNSVKAGALAKVALDEEKSIDLDEIIDLDDYGDDMDDIENNEADKTKNKQATQVEQDKSETEASAEQKTNGTETWASRYYQTDDVQNVIKESKIQSEIRKRLRERQRLSKLSTSPNMNSPSPPVSDTANKNIVENNTLGSVDEYLALKYTAVTSLSTGNNDSSITKDSIDTDDVNEDDQTSKEVANEQSVDKEISSNEDANAETESVTKNVETVSVVDSSNSG